MSLGRMTLMRLFMGVISFNDLLPEPYMPFVFPVNIQPSWRP